MEKKSFLEFIKDYQNIINGKDNSQINNKINNNQNDETINKLKSEINLLENKIKEYETENKSLNNKLYNI